MRWMLIVVLVLVTHVATAIPAQAEPIRDVAYDAPILAYGTYQLGPDYPGFIAMTTPVRRAGRLTHVELPLSRRPPFETPAGTVQFWILPVVSAHPVYEMSAALASGAIDPSVLPFQDNQYPPVLPPFTRLSTGSARVSAGQQIAIVLGLENLSGSIYWNGLNEDSHPFPEGTHWFRENCDPATRAGCSWRTFISEGGENLGFRTFVDPSPAPVPEPASLVLIGTGWGVVALRRRALRRR